MKTSNLTKYLTISAIAVLVASASNISLAAVKSDPYDDARRSMMAEQNTKPVAHHAKYAAKKHTAKKRHITKKKTKAAVTQ